jgi:uncharacterized protein (TIGR02611 family)
MSTDDHPPEAGRRPARARGRLHRRLHANPALALTTKIVVTTVGVLVLLGGAVMLVTPGPGIVGVALGLGILATEYEWAHRWLEKVRDKAHDARLRAEAMDPRQRRRRLLGAGLVFLVVAAGIVTYIVIFDWPRFAIDGWVWLQGMTGWIPDLPGM